MADGVLLYELREGVAWITLNRPGAFNALDLPTMQALLDAANRCATDPLVRAVVLTGSGERAFCAGGDVAAFVAGQDNIGLLLREMTAALHMAIARFASLGAPVIAAVNGVAAGAGLSLVACCDLAIAAGHATFTSAYTRIGLTPDGSSTHFLPRLIGPRRAAELYLTNRVLSAAEALDWGLVNQVVPAAELLAEAGALAARLAAGPAGAHGGLKRLLRLAPDLSLEAQMEQESREIIAAAVSADGREGVRAFVEKRPARFEGT